VTVATALRRAHAVLGRCPHRPQREAVAGRRLEADGFTILAPRIRAKRQIISLFPHYLFVRIETVWRLVDRTPGVEPAKCPDSEIDRIRSQMDADGVVRLPKPPSASSRAKPAFKPGAKVLIAAGPFKGRTGIYAGMSAGDRELVLMNILGAQRPVAVAASLIQAR
jgi:transcription antitermination factor NusG